MKKYFHTTKKVVEIKTIPFTKEQLSEALFTHKPKEIYHRQWGEKIPFIVITEYFEDSFMLYCNGLADRTPMRFDAAKLHDALIAQGLEDCYFKS